MPCAETDPRDIAVKQVSCLAITVKVMPCTMAVTDPRDITIVRMVYSPTLSAHLLEKRGSVRECCLVITVK